MSFTVRPLGPTDAAAVQELLEHSPGYTHRVRGREVAPGDGNAVLESLPPGVDPAARTVFGLLATDGPLLAVLDVITGWPEPGTAHIGLLLTRQNRRREGLGRLLHDSVLAQLRARGGIDRLRAGIVATNALDAEPFWQRLGYRPTGITRPCEAGIVATTTAIWERGTSPSAGLHHLELWTADLTVTEPAWHWLLSRLGWRGEQIDGWTTGRIWRHPDGSHLVLEQSEDVSGDRAHRMRPGMNHVALTAPDRRTLEDLPAAAADHGWSELFSERFPHAGGPEHAAWYAENAEGVEVEVVAEN